MGIAGVACKYGMRVAKLLPEFLLGTGAEAVGKGLRRTKGSIWTKIRGGAKALEKDIATKSKNGGFFKRTFKEIINTPKDIKHWMKVGKRAAKTSNALAKTAGKAATKSIAGGTFKGACKAVLKKMPVLGIVATLAFDGPEIYNAFKERGFKAGMKEVLGVGSELGIFSTCLSIGSYFGPYGAIAGGIIGAILGCITRNAITTNKEKEAQEPEQENNREPVEYTKEQKETLKAIGLSDDEIQELQANGATYEEVIQKIKEIEAEEAQRQQQARTSTTNSPTTQTAPTETTTNPTTNETDELASETTSQGTRETSTSTTTNNQSSESAEKKDEYQPLVYQAPMFNPYAFSNPFMTNPFNTYSNDIMGQSIFNTGYTNPYLSFNLYQNPFAYMNSFQPLNSFGYMNPYFQQGNSNFVA